MKHSAVLCDTSFFIRLLDKNDPLHTKAKDYFKYFLERENPLLISTISIGEYCVVGDINDLPLKNLQILPFNFDHAIKAGEFAGIIFNNKNILKAKNRNIIPNDTKLFAQADSDASVEFYLTSDSESKKIYDLLKQHSKPKFQFTDISKPYTEVFGILDL